MPQCAQSILCQAGTPEHQPGPCNPFLAMFPLLWGLPGVSVVQLGGSEGDPHPWGWDSRATAMVTLQRWHQGAFTAAVQGTRQFCHQKPAAPKAWLGSLAPASAAPCAHQSPNHLLPPKCELVTSQGVWAVLPSLPCSRLCHLSVPWVWLHLGAVVGAVKSCWRCHTAVLRLPSRLFPAGSWIFTVLGGFLGDECLL